MAEHQPQEHYIEIGQATERFGLTENQIFDLVNQQKVRLILFSSRDSNKIGVHEKDLLQEMFHRSRYEAMYGNRIVSMREAARLVNVMPSTIHRWVQEGHIRRMSQVEGAENQPVEGIHTSRKQHPHTIALLLADVFYYNDVFRLRLIELDASKDLTFGKDGRPNLPATRRKYKSRKRPEDHQE